jgi:nucleotide-binding universal stress UspA family protein
MIEDVMVHLDGSPEDEVRLEHARALSASGRTHVIGVFTNLLPDLTMAMPIEGGAFAIQALAEVEEKARREGDEIAIRVQEKLKSLALSSDFRRIDEPVGLLSFRVAELARCADLFIATRPGDDNATSPALGRDLVEEILFGSGRALLLVPPGHRPRSVGPVLIAWNGSREAARALREGMGFIEEASRVVVLAIDAESGKEPTEVSSHLTRHGVSAELVSDASDGRNVADVILDHASRCSADLIVMGGYGHSRLREQILGGVTASLLALSSRPLLLAH